MKKRNRQAASRLKQLCCFKNLKIHLTSIIYENKHNLLSNSAAPCHDLIQTKGAFQWASRPPTGDQPVTRSQWNTSG